MNWKFWKRKKKEESETTPWGDPIENPESQAERSSFTNYVRGGFRSRFSSKKPRKKYRFKYLLRIKRLMAGLLFIVYLLSFIMALFGGLTIDPVSLMFFATAFIMLDYLWKTKRTKWIDDKPADPVIQTIENPEEKPDE